MRFRATLLRTSSALRPRANHLAAANRALNVTNNVTNDVTNDYTNTANNIYRNHPSRLTANKRQRRENDAWTNSVTATRASRGSESPVAARARDGGGRRR